MAQGDGPPRRDPPSSEEGITLDQCQPQGKSSAAPARHNRDEVPETRRATTPCNPPPPPPSGNPLCAMWAPWGHIRRPNDDRGARNHGQAFVRQTHSLQTEGKLASGTTMGTSLFPIRPSQGLPPEANPEEELAPGTAMGTGLCPAPRPAEGPQGSPSGRKSRRRTGPGHRHGGGPWRPRARPFVAKSPAKKSRAKSR